MVLLILMSVLFALSILFLFWTGDAFDEDRPTLGFLYVAAAIACMFASHVSLFYFLKVR